MKLIWCSCMGHCEVRDTSRPHVVIMEGPLTDVVPKLLESGRDVELRFNKGNQRVDLGYMELRYFWLSLCRDEDLYQHIGVLLKATDYLQKNPENAGEHEIVGAANALRRAMSARGRQL